MSDGREEREEQEQRRKWEKEKKDRDDDLDRDWEREGERERRDSRAVSASNDLCPAGRASCAEGGHFVTRIPLRMALPLVAKEVDFRPAGGP
jgi:hypothetical protein